jgi:hypothetical protein
VCKGTKKIQRMQEIIEKIAIFKKNARLLVYVRFL